MAAVYKHVAALQILVVILLLIDAAGPVDAIRGRHRKRDNPDKTPSHQESSNKTNCLHKHHTDMLNSFNSDGNNTVVCAQTRSTAVLHCNTSDLETSNDTTVVKWYKMLAGGPELLTEGNNVLTNDKRIYASNQLNSQDWSLYIRYTKSTDGGLYQCQSSNSTEALYFTLELVDTYAVIIGGPKKIVKTAGSPLRLSCVLRDDIEPATYIFWYHGDRMINYDLGDGANVREGRQGSELIFPRANETHAGNYSCVPSNARQASVEVIFSDGQYAIENARKNNGAKYRPLDCVVNMLVLISTFHLCRRH